MTIENLTWTVDYSEISGKKDSQFRKISRISSWLSGNFWNKNIQLREFLREKSWLSGSFRKKIIQLPEFSRKISWLWANLEKKTFKYRNFQGKAFDYRETSRKKNIQLREFQRNTIEFRESQKKKISLIIGIFQVFNVFKWCFLLIMGRNLYTCGSIVRHVKLSAPFWIREHSVPKVGAPKTQELHQLSRSWWGAIVIDILHWV